MENSQQIEFVTASHDEKILNSNLLRSGWILKYGLSIQKGFTNVAEAYNKAVTSSPIVIYVHQDVFLPSDFECSLFKALKEVPDDFGVLGVAGVKLVDGKKEIHGYISDRRRLWGSPQNLPHLVQTLDEMLLITRGDIIFDEQLPQDFYGADICMQAIARGQRCYAINAYCEHNSGRSVGGRTESFYKSQEYFRNKWIDHLPIVTTCALIN